jgi:type I restriction enzyme S subunit
LSDLKYAVDGSLDLAELYVVPGDVLFVRTNGSKDLIGRAAVVHEHLGIAFASYLIRFRLVADVVNPVWVRTVVSSPMWRRLIESQAASSAGQYNVNLKILGSLPIPVPPREEQEAIVAELVEQSDRLKRLDIASKSISLRAGALRRSLLTAAINGQLAPQDPADQPATELLDRLKAMDDARPKLTRAAKEPPVAPRKPELVHVGIQEELPL